jgi:hypothetical protein
MLGKLGGQSPLFSFIAGSQQDFHIHEDRNTENACNVLQRITGIICC